MSKENFYDLRKQYREASRKTEAQYRDDSLRVASTPLRNIGEAYDEGTRRMEMGRGYSDMVVPNLQQGQYGEAAKNFATGTALNVAGGFNRAMSPVTGLVNTVLPDLGITERIMQTDLGQRATQLAAENPRAAATLGSLADIGMLRGGASSIPASLQAIADNTPTKIEGFYNSPDPMNKLMSTLKAAGPNVGLAVKQGFSPQAQATRRGLGTGEGRRAEYNESTGVIRDANALQSSFIETQRRGETAPAMDTVVGNTVEVQRFAQDWTDFSNKERVKTGLASYTDDIPDNVLEGAMEHLYQAHGVGDRKRKDASGNETIDSVKPGKTSLVVRRPQTGEGLQGEALGVSKGTSPSAISALASSTILDSAKKAMPDATPLEFYKRFVSVAKQGHMDKIRLAIREGDLPEASRSNLLNSYWRFKIREQKGQKISPNQQKILDFFDRAPEARLRDRGNGVYSFAENHASSAQDLGSVNNWVAVDTKNDNVYAMISDGHDMFGMDPPGGNSLLNTTPIYSFKVGTKNPEKKDLDRPTESVTRIEEITGMKKQQGESNVQYQSRVMRDYKGTANLEDYMAAGKNVGRAGMLTGASINENEEQQR
jgi:hypothetical protein